ncbi:MAG: hypothetical protein IPO09_19105 [Anaeromyxobacter sp.]|nr:hypothetical protein [Anaeromyxobacter sp.]
MSRLVSDLEFTSGGASPAADGGEGARPLTPPPDAGTLPEPTYRGGDAAPCTAAGGVQVVIRGQHLRVSEVMFGSRAAWHRGRQR